MIGPKTIEEYLHAAQGIGALSATAVWALVTIALACYIFWSQKKYREEQAASIEARVKLSQAVESLSRALDAVSAGLSELKIIVSERIPRRD